MGLLVAVLTEPLYGGYFNLEETHGKGLQRSILNCATATLWDDT